MTLNQQMRFWAAALAAVLFLLWLFADILLPFVAGMALAYLLDPVADRLERHGVPRLAATLLILTVFAAFFIILLVALVPVLVSQLDSFILRFPEYSDRLKVLFDQWSQGWVGRLLQDGSQKIESNIGTILQNLASWVGSFAKSLLSGGMAVVNMVALLVVTPVVAFYLLVDWDNMISRLDDLLPRNHKQEIRRIMGEIDEALSGFIRGQTMVCAILGGFYAIGLTLIGLNFGLLIGLVAGLISFIPYVGSIVGFGLSMGVALVQFWPQWPWILVVAGIFFAGQMIEGYILQPRLIGRSVGLHPVWLMFALFAFGYLFGFVGLLIAVPAAAAIAVLIRFALDRYLASPLYHGHGQDDGAR